jgi:hypothetical protein
VRRPDVLFTLAAANEGGATIDRIEYPIIAGIGRLGGPGQDELVHSHATGMLFRDPLDLFEADPENRRRLRRSPYPEGFHGSTMQMMAYYARDRGGFFVGTEDAGAAIKELDLFKEGDALCATVVHKAPIHRPGLGFAPDYPVVLAGLDEGSGWAAGDRYRRWALGQPWAQSQPRRSSLREQVGICTFGINARFDRSAWLDAFRGIAGTPVFHVLGPNWPNFGQDYQNNLPRGRDDWFPARFDRANLEAIRRNGDFWAPFEFDLLCNESPELPDPVLASRLVPKPDEPNASAVRFPFMCAATDYWHDLHVWRDATLVAEHGCDALYYDISVSNLLPQCLAAGHRHAPGAGTAIVDAFRAMYRDTNEAMARARGGHVPSGTEVISECFLREFDFYQARAEATPLAPFEVDVFRDWITRGRAEKIPLFAYVFGERGPVRMDGWAKLAGEAGELFYWTAARVLLNGGLLQLNYEFSNLEDIAGHSEDADQHYYPFEPRRYAVDREKAAFVGQVARARVGPANPLLARGRMLPPPKVEAPTVELDYFLYNCFTWLKHDQERGSMSVPAVLATAWRHGDRTAWLLANVSSVRQHPRVDGPPFDLPARSVVFVER